MEPRLLQVVAEVQGRTLQHSRAGLVNDHALQALEAQHLIDLGQHRVGVLRANRHGCQQQAAGHRQRRARRGETLPDRPDENAGQDDGAPGLCVEMQNRDAGMFVPDIAVEVTRTFDTAGTWVAMLKHLSLDIPVS